MFNGSWITKLCAVLGGISAIVAIVVPPPSKIGVIALAASQIFGNTGVYHARQNNVTSKQAGAE